MVSCCPFEDSSKYVCKTSKNPPLIIRVPLVKNDGIHYCFMIRISSLRIGGKITYLYIDSL